MIASGENVYVEFKDWVNKSLPRFQIRIGCDSRDDIAEESWPTTYSPGLSIEDAISHLIPWADYEMDLDAHRECMKSVWYNECYSGHDKETDTTYFSTPFEEWHTPPEEMSPIYEGGEVAEYRLILSLNDIGKAFLILDEFLSEEDEIGQRVFTLE